MFNKSHPTSLHGYKQNHKVSENETIEDEKQDFHCATVNTSSEVIRMCVVPVVVKHKNSNKVIKTYAMLDSCSQGTFVKESLLGYLRLQKRKTSITIKTINGEVTKRLMCYKI